MSDAVEQPDSVVFVWSDFTPICHTTNNGYTIVTRTTSTNSYHNRNQLNYVIVNNLQYQHYTMTTVKSTGKTTQSEFIICYITTEYHRRNNKLFIMILMTF